MKKNNYIPVSNLLLASFFGLLTSFYPYFTWHVIPEKPKISPTSESASNKNSRIIQIEKKLPLIDSAIMAWHSNRHLNGSVLVAVEDKILYEEYLGYSDPVRKIHIQPHSSFQIASVSKIFTAVAVLMLKDKGLIRLDDSVQTYLPGFPYHGITIRHLLSHQSGLPNYIYTLLPKLKQHTKPNNAVWYEQFIGSGLKPLFTPGSKFHYCNTNYALLAFIVEKISGKTFSEFLSGEIFIPLGMHHTFTFPESFDKKFTCRAFTKKGRPEITDENDFILGDKGIFSTPRDLFKFAYALHSGRILSDDSYREATSVQAKEAEHKDYGLGFRLRNATDSLNKDIYHNGWWHGYRSAFHYIPAEGLLIIMMSNRLDKHVYYTSIIRELLMGTSVTEPEDEN